MTRKKHHLCDGPPPKGVAAVVERAPLTSGTGEAAGELLRNGPWLKRFRKREQYFGEGKMKNRHLIFLGGVWILMAMTVSAWALPPMATLQEPITKVMDLLQNTRFENGSPEKAAREQILAVIWGVFDSRELARRSLARHWRSLSPQEKEEFTEVFARFIGNTYLSKIQGNCQDVKIDFLSEEIITPTKAIVKTKIIRENIDVAVAYRLHRRQEAWKVYDVNVEGVSLVKNYRSQFRKILDKQPPSFLIQRLKEKTRL